MKSFLFVPFRALFDLELYRLATRQWRIGQTGAFLFYLVMLHMIAMLLVWSRHAVEARPFLGPLNEEHMLIRFLSAAPYAWEFSAEGLTLKDENGQSVEIWNFPPFFYVDTTRQGDFNPPGAYYIIASKTMLWTSQEYQSRVLRFQDMHAERGGDLIIHIYRDAGGSFDHFEILNPQGGTQFFSRADLKRSYGMFKVLIFFVLMVIVFFYFLVYKLCAILLLTLFGFLFGKILKRDYTYGQIFIICALVQAWPWLIFLLEAMFPLPGPVGGLLRWTISLGMLYWVFLRLPDDASSAGNIGAQSV